MTVQLPPCPPSLKSIQHYLKTATEHDGRDPVISYWCRLYALQAALKVDKKSDEAKILLMSLMDWLEKEKKRMADNEAVTNDVAGQAHIENYALKLFLWADGQDRASVFNKNVVKAFYTAGFLMDVLTIFGEQTEEVQQNCKYAKWKAAYIHNCLRNGEMPVPGPMGGQEDGAGMDGAASHPSSSIGFEDVNQPDRADPTPSSSSSNASISGGPSTVHFPTPTSGTPSFNLPTPPSDPGSYTDLPSSVPATNYSMGRFGATFPNLPPHLVPKPFVPPPATSVPAYDPSALVSPSASSENSAKLQPDQIQKAQKYCKWAGSALNYDDVPEAITNLRKALHLLTTGQDS